MLSQTRKIKGKVRDLADQIERVANLEDQGRENSPEYAAEFHKMREMNRELKDDLTSPSSLAD